MGKRILIIGGVAAGSSCATRARRLDEAADIHVFERGPYVSFANCGLPYHVGNVIEDEDSLLLTSPERFQERHDIQVHVDHEVVAINPLQQTLLVRDRKTGSMRGEHYDALVLATGAGPVRPPVEGLDLPGVFTLRTVPQTREVKRWLAETGARRAVVVGGGLVGLEVAENLRHLDLAVTVVERADHVLPLLDPEMAVPVQERLEAEGVVLHLGDGLAAIRQGDDGLTVETAAGAALPADVVVLGLGVRPQTELAVEAGLTLGPRGGVAVDAYLLTSDPNIWAVGDVAEKHCTVTGQPRVLPMAGPANREGRRAADAICGRVVPDRGVQGTSVCRLFGLTVAATGRSATDLRTLGVPFEETWLHPSDHVGYYPGARTIHLKLLYGPRDGRILGAQAVGEAGADKRIDVIAMALQLGGTVYDLEQAELCYSPQVGAAKDPVNMAGMVAANHLRGDLPQARWSNARSDNGVLIDVREPEEFARGHIGGARNLPLSELRDRLDELPRDKVLRLYCWSGKRSYDAARALVQHGLDARTLPGGFQSWRQLEAAGVGH